jgi:flagellar basal-body rod modification protein FlgD
MTVDGVSSNGTQQTNSASQAKKPNDADMFLTLLTTQLKAQDPLSPMDPTAMVGQLVQFNTLNEIVKIRSLLETGAAPKTPEQATGNR